MTQLNAEEKKTKKIFFIGSTPGFFVREEKKFYGIGSRLMQGIYFASGPCYLIWLLIKNGLSAVNLKREIQETFQIFVKSKKVCGPHQSAFKGPNWARRCSGVNFINILLHTFLYKSAFLYKSVAFFQGVEKV